MALNNEARARLVEGPRRLSVSAVAGIAALIVLFVLGSCRANGSPTDDAERPRVKRVLARRLSFVETLESYGTVSFLAKNDVTAMVEGTIAELGAREGVVVSKGQPLATLRNVQMELELARAKCAVESAEAALNGAMVSRDEARRAVEARLLSLQRSDIAIRQKTRELEDAKKKLAIKESLHGIGGITDQGYGDALLSVLSLESEIEVAVKEREIQSIGLRERDLTEAGIEPCADESARVDQFIDLNIRGIDAQIESASANLGNARGSVESIERLLDQLTIRAPCSGIVGAQYFERGEFVKQNEKAFTIIDTSKVYAVFSVQERDIVSFDKGSPLRITVESIGRDIDARITEISPMADPESGNFTVKALMANGLGMKPGMFVRCSMPRGKESACIVVPDTSLVRKTGDDGSVFAIANGVAVLRQVRIRADKGGMVWTESGIAENEPIVDCPSPFLKEGMRVAID